MYRGYLALWRKFQDHPFWLEKREYSKAEAWIDMLWEVQHSEKPIEVVLGMKCLVCNYGDSLNSLETWSKRWGWNKSRVRRFFKLLENMGQIRQCSETKTTRITVLNYNQYDPKRHASDTQVKRKRHASDTHPTPDKNDKKVNNDINDYKPEWISAVLWGELIKNRKFKKLQNTQLALTTFTNSLKKGVEAGFTIEVCIGEYVASSWKRFDHKWIKRKPESNEWE